MLTKAEFKSLKLVRDTGRPYVGQYRHNIRQWDMWQRLVKRGLMGARHRMITPAGRKALKAVNG